MKRSFAHRITVFALSVVAVLSGYTTILIIKNLNPINLWLESKMLQPVEIVSYPSALDTQMWPISDNKTSLADNGFSLSYQDGAMMIARDYQSITLTRTGEIYDTKTHLCTMYAQATLNIINSCSMANGGWALAYTQGETIFLKYESGEWFYVLLNEHGFYH